MILHGPGHLSIVSNGSSINPRLAWRGRSGGVGKYVRSIARQGLDPRILLFGAKHSLH